MRLIKRFISILLRHPLCPNMVRVFAIKKRGDIGDNFKIGSGSVIRSKNLKIGHNVTIMKNVVIHSDDIVIGNDTVIMSDTTIEAKKYVHIGSECIINQQVIIGGGQTANSSFFMGKRVHIYPFCFLNTTMPLVLEDGVGIGGGTYVFTHGSWQDAYEGFPYAYAPVTIKKNAWLPWRVFVMPGITIGEEATIGSDALITKDIPDRSFAVGVPAKVLKQGYDYIKEMTPERKTDLMKEIFTAFKDHQSCFKQNESVLTTEGNTLILTFESGNKIVYSIDQSGSYGEKSLIVTEWDNDKKVPVHVFDLKNKRCSWPLNELEHDFHGYLTNYGIRLDIENKYA